ncbi:multidrug ABC transporter substrate-binding protein [Colwellia sp. PAMC 20917]|uniref:ABC transporter permease n=1 Tax=Colwellia sp. PAMC 20917 TaxID=1816218 RepID=UPI000877FE89|nr:ABC transporter permease [Colwellia sp. PAMC 20917]AOW78092.1 multidrug ABC transporter substrate-binding protein [Colwellia sp. PAMC 20917]
MSSVFFKVVESTRSAAHSVRAHGFRSFLTTLGIIIGVASVIAVVSVVQGLSSSITSQFDDMGTNVVSINAFTPLKERLQGKVAKLSYRDFLEIQYKVSGISHITPTVAATGPNGVVQYKGESTATRVVGTGSSYQSLYGIFPETGRFFNINDDKSRRRVAVLGDSIIDKLEIKGSAVGQYIMIGGEWFKVIGVLEKRGKLFGFDQDDFILLPYTTTRALLGGAEEPDISISLQVDDASQLNSIKQHIKNLLRRNHNLSKDTGDDFKISTAEQMLETVNDITSNTTMVLSGVVGISLLVGGIGIMNIMLVSVTERTREIGIQKALGATRVDILLQFLIEAVFLCLLGGLIGLALGYGAGALVSSLIDLPSAEVPMWAIMLSFGFSAGVGLLFGIIPAAKAANLDPIDALRYE